MKKLIFITIFILFYSLNSFADTSYFLDFTKVLNSSKPGADAQKKLKDRFNNETKKFNKMQKDIISEETLIISQKKTLSSEEYKKQVLALRKKVANLQKKKQDSFNNIAKSRDNSKIALLNAVNPIIKKYMEDNKIRLILDKKTVVLGDTKLEVTDQIIAIINKEITSLKTN